MKGSKKDMVPDEEDKEFMKMVDRAGYLAIAKGNLHEAQNCLDLAESIMTVDMDGPEYADLSHQFKLISDRIWELEKRAEKMQNELTWDLAWRANPPEEEELGFEIEPCPICGMAPQRLSVIGQFFKSYEYVCCNTAGGPHRFEGGRYENVVMAAKGWNEECRKEKKR